MPYQIITLTGSLQFPPYWRGVTAQQQIFLDHAAEMIKEMAVALDAIDAKGTHVCNNDLQLPRGTTVRSKEAEIAHRVLRKWDDEMAVRFLSPKG